MRTTLSQQKFLDSDVAVTVRAQLERMLEDPAFNTCSTYAALAEDTPFVEKHMNYLSDHPKLDPQHYVANLRLMTRIKR